MSIPKVIHYVWMGRNDKPSSVVKCIESWKKALPEYDIIEWNESNFNVNDFPYCKSAYEKKKWAFVSDYVRLYVLYKYGGIYLDTDVFVKKAFDDLLAFDLFLGKMYHTVIGTAVIGSQKGNLNIKTLMDNYDNGLYGHEIANNFHFTKHFCDKYSIDILSKSERILFNNSVLLDRFSFENPSLFYLNGYSVHHFDGSWIKKSEKSHLYKFFSNIFRRIDLLFYLERYIRTNR